ncbi:hypothetical protein [Pseudoalteromonas denitrificans]|uniref:NIPSNAP protein n=1 Tax=Pseudoalteromonas denitrificans DSM 6059 TaxID=1123010 RepID=A0A1I1LFH4_9GAMM|nr:hypothetical protein [Pseudoalteromonas denitrificans]SFC71716.1 hypothetical protein SAMN02745724_02351 [Pseudoalteromonas denitrificans DSM 6059]
MMLARWSIDAKFGHKPNVVNSLSHWFKDIGSQIGWHKGKYRIITGSVGALESQIISEITIENLAELNNSWNKLGDIEAHASWSKELEPHIVSGTQKWEIFRIVE